MDVSAIPILSTNVVKVSRRCPIRDTFQATVHLPHGWVPDRRTTLPPPPSLVLFLFLLGVHVFRGIWPRNELWFRTRGTVAAVGLSCPGKNGLCLTNWEGTAGSQLRLTFPLGRIWLNILSSMALVARDCMIKRHKGEPRPDSRPSPLYRDPSRARRPTKAFRCKSVHHHHHRRAIARYAIYANSR